jgi:predicted transcriptional regulator
MSRDTIASLTRKGYSQYKIARTLHIRKQKVATYQRTHRIGKRAPEGGAKEFWKDVTKYKEITGSSHKEATEAVKFGEKWFSKALKRGNKRTKARLQILRKWWEVRTKGVTAKMFFESEEGEGLMEAAEYE